VAVRSGITFIVSYQCPQCGAALEGKTTQPEAWLRCPSCGRASQAPDHAIAPEAPVSRQLPDEEVLVIGPAPEPTPMTPVAVAAVPSSARSSEPGNPIRVAYAAALFVSVVLLVFSFLDQGMIGTSVFSVAAVIFLVLLARPDRTADRRR
jgi:hypothetical protein